MTHKSPLSVAFAHSGKVVLLAHPEGKLSLFDSQDGCLIQTLSHGGKLDFSATTECRCRSSSYMWKTSLSASSRFVQLHFVSSYRYTYWLHHLKQAYCSPKTNVWRIVTASATGSSLVTPLKLWQAGEPTWRALTSRSRRQVRVAFLFLTSTWYLLPAPYYSQRLPFSLI